MRRKRQISFDVLEGKALLSTGDPLTQSFGGLSEQEYLGLQFILQQQAANMDAMPVPVQDANMVEIHIIPIPDDPQPTPVPEDPSWYQWFLDAVDASIKAATESSTPLFPAIP
jgi:hypothetical protein